MEQQDMVSIVEAPLHNVMFPLVRYLKEKLSYSQQSRLKRLDAPSLDELDLAALLRVLDQNWYQLSNSQGFTNEDRHYVKEMMTIRNRWAHADTQPRHRDDIFRDLDTIQRFARIINAGEKFDETLGEAKSKIYSSSMAQKAEVPSEKKCFSPGDMVQIKSRPGEMGAVIAVSAGQPEARVTVFINNTCQQFYESQILPCALQTEQKEQISCNQFHSRLSALQINCKVMTEHLRANR